MLRAQLIGNLGADAVLREHNGRHAISFSVAHNEKFRESNGERRERTMWVSCTLWRDSAENLVRYLTKGTTVYVEGDPKPELYRTREGQPAVSLSIRVTKLDFVAAGRQDEAPAESPARA